jgi:hypothetical protein
MKTLSSFLYEEPTRKMVLTFMRANPPTAGHAKVIERVAMIAKKVGSDFRIYLSQSQDAKKNPLNYNQKIRYLRLAFPQYAKNIINDSEIKTIFGALRQLADKGYDDITIVVGSDRVPEFQSAIKPYLTHSDPEKALRFKKLQVFSAGDRDPDDEGVAGISATKMRQFAADNDYDSFATGVPSGLSPRFSKEMFQDVRKAMNLKR